MPTTHPSPATPALIVLNLAPERVRELLRRDDAKRHALNFPPRKREQGKVLGDEKIRAAIARELEKLLVAWVATNRQPPAIPLSRLTALPLSRLCHLRQPTAFGKACGLQCGIEGLFRQRISQNPYEFLL